MKRYPFLPILLFSILVFSCDSPSKETDNFNKLGAAEIVLETGASTWSTYKGKIPCADCEGIQMELKLENKSNKAEKEFELFETYIGTKDGDRNYSSRGTYEVKYGVDDDPAAILIMLMDKNNKATKAFIQEDDQSLKLLSNAGKMVDSKSNYSLKKQ